MIDKFDQHSREILLVFGFTCVRQHGFHESANKKFEFAAHICVSRFII